MNLFDARQLRGEGAKKAGCPGSDRETKDRADQSEKKRFREQLCDERTARSSQREANGDFVLTLGCARQKERNNIRAGDQLKQRDGAEEQPERPA